MDVITSDNVYHKLPDDFVDRSQLLKDMSPGKVHVPFSDSVMQKLIQGDFPKDGQGLLEVAKAADFLNMEWELKEACRRIATTLKGMTTKEIEKFLSLSPC